MKKALKKTLSVFLSVLMLLSVFAGIEIRGETPAQAVSVGNYCATAAAKWAYDHYQEYSSCLLGTNYWYDGGDCANFVSQSLYMGGMDMTGYWNTNGYLAHWTEPYGNTYAGSFIRCTQLYNFLVNVMGGQSINNPSASQVSVGDVLIYSAPGASRKTHSAIVIDIVGGVPIVAAHSVDNVKYTGYDGQHEWHLGFPGSRTWLIKLNGTLCVNYNPKSFDVYTAGSGDLGLYSDAWGSRLTTFLSGEYAHVYRTKSSGGYTWGYTFRYGKWGWVKLSSFHYRSHQQSPAVDHIFGEWKLVSPGSCAANGTEECVCTRCGYRKTREIPGGHIAGGATCTAPSVCTVCGTYLADPLGHDASGAYTVTKAPACTEAGEETLFCVRKNNGVLCNAVLDVRAIPALGHDYVAETSSPTCTLTGTQQLTCNRCGDKRIDYINAENTLSEWTDEVIPGLTPVETKTQYRYSDYETTTSSSSSLDGWTQIGKEYSAWSGWSGWSRTTVSSNDLTDVQTTPMYRYYCYKCGSCGMRDPYSGTCSSCGSSVYWTETWSTTAYKNTQYSTFGKPYTTGLGDGLRWYFSIGNLNDTAIGTIDSDSSAVVIQQGYRSRTRTVTYTFGRWTDFSAWQDAPVEASDVRRVETRTLYKYDLKALGHIPALSEEKNYYGRDQALAYSDTGSYGACYWRGTYCAREGCGFHLDTTDYMHVLPVFDKDNIDLSVWSIAPESNENVTIYKAYCENGCGCYTLATVENHSYAVTTVAPTCLTAGYDLHTCTLHENCYYTDNAVPALGHDYAGEQEYAAPTCTEAGYLKTYCVRFDGGVTCDAYQLEEYAPLGHNMTAFEATAPTCLLDGSTAYYHCTVCGGYFADEAGNSSIEADSWILPATGHNGKNAENGQVWVTEVENGCGVTGYEYNYCQNPWCDGLADCSFDHGHAPHGFLLEIRAIEAIEPDYYPAYTNDYAEFDETTGEFVPTSCVYEGLVYYTCRLCEGTDRAHSYLPDVVYAPESVGILAHNESEWIVDTPAYCVHSGLRHTECTRCGKVLQEEMIAAPNAAHDYAVAETISSACTAGSDLVHYVCTRCGETSCETCAALGTPHHYWEGEPAEHDLGEYVVTEEPTCEQPGYRHRECQNEGCTYRTAEETLAPIGHDYAAARTVAPTCTAAGYTEYVCRNDGSHTYIADETPALGHDLRKTDALAPTCLENGNILYYTCARAACGKIFADEAAGKELTADSLPLPALGHDWGDWTDDGESGHIRVCRRDASHTETDLHVWDAGEVTKTPTCKEEGETLYTCAVCDATKTEPIAVDPENHAGYGTMILREAAADCLAPGYTGDVVCNGCGKVLTAGEEIPALGHDWGAWADDAEGNHSRVCRRDASHTETDLHAWDAGEVTKTPTCKEEGETLYTCTVCGATKTEPIAVDPENHADYGTHKGNEAGATCLEPGYTGDVVCNGCGKVLTAGEKIDPTGHDWGEWETVRESTAAENGEAKRVCKNDASHVQTKALPVLTPDTSENEEIDTKKDAVYDPASGTAEIRLHAESMGDTVKTRTVTPLDIVLVLDQSGSMKYQMNSNSYIAGSTTSRLAHLKDAATSFVQKIYTDSLIGADHRISVVGFAMGGTEMKGTDVDGVSKTFGKFENTNILSLAHPVTFTAAPASLQTMNEAYRSSLVSVNTGSGIHPLLTGAISALDGKGATAADYGLMMACKVFEQNPAEGRRRVVVFMTDGEPTYSSGFNTVTAENAKENARILRDVYGATVYSVGVFGSGITNQCKNFLIDVAGGVNNYYSVADKEQFINSFKTIADESTHVETAFDDVTLVDTVSAEFTLTEPQEKALKAYAVENMGVSAADVAVRRRADGTTEIRISHIHPKAEVRGEDTYFTVDCSFTVSANENTLAGGEYDTNTRNAGVMIGDGTVFEKTFTPASVVTDAAEGVVYFNINGKPFHTVRVHAGDALQAPVLTLEGDHTFSGWEIPEPIAFVGGKAEIEATLESPLYTVTWNYDGMQKTVSYHEGDVITAPVPASTENGLFSGWNAAVPVMMPAENLVFTAQYVQHTHDYRSFVVKRATCGAAGTERFVCACGDAYERQLPALKHKYITFATEEQQKGISNYSYVVCENCGRTLEESFTYTVTGTVSKRQTTYDLKLTDAQSITVQPNGMIQISLVVPNDMRYASNLKISRREADGSMTDLHGTYSRSTGLITFVTDHFSTYILTAEYSCDETGEHSFALTGSVPATCTGNGSRTYECTVCGDTKTETETARGHSWSAWTPLTPAACTSDGKEQRVCANDPSHVETRPIAKTGHADANGDGACDTCGAVLGGTQQNLCACGKNHTGPFAWLIRFFHGIVYFFKNLFR